MNTETQYADFDSLLAWYRSDPPVRLHATTDTKTRFATKKYYVNPEPKKRGKYNKQPKQTPPPSQP